MRKLTERVVGIVITRASVDPVTDTDKVPFILASAALWHRIGPGYLAFDGAYVKLRPGATAGDVTREAQALVRRFPKTGGQAYVADESTQVAAIEQSIRPEAVALAIFAVVLACTALLIVGQAATRLLLQAGSDNPVLAALGMTRRQLTVAGLIEVAVAGAAGAILAAGVAIAASPLMPIGAARLAEPAPGISADWLVLPIGATAIVVLLLARAAWPAWRLGSSRGVREPAAAATGRRAWLAGLGLPVTVTAGVRLALEPGQGRTAVPVRSALVGTTLSVLAVTAAFTFGASLLNLVHTPRLYGQAWDAAIDLQFQVISPAQAQQRFGTNPGVTGWTYGDHGIIGVNGQLIPAIGLAPGRGPLISPTLLAGRAPRTSHEIVLGTSTLRHLGLQVGQQVTVTVSGQRMPDRIVGSAVFPNFGQGSFTPTDLGEGAETTAAVLRPQAVPTGGLAGYEFVLLRFAPGPGRAAAVTRFRRSMTRFLLGDSAIDLRGAQPAAERGDQLRAHRRHPRGARRSARRPRRGRARPAGRGIQPAQAARLRHLEGAGPAPPAGQRGHRLAGEHAGRARPADRPAAGGGGGPVELAAVRKRPRHPGRCHCARPAGAADGAGGDFIANAVALWPGRSAARVSPAQVLRVE